MDLKVEIDDNDILRKERKSYLKSGPPIWPAIVINGAVYKVIVIY